jgi:hypothetical protein
MNAAITGSIQKAFVFRLPSCHVDLRRSISEKCGGDMVMDSQKIVITQTCTRQPLLTIEVVGSATSMIDG